MRVVSSRCGGAMIDTDLLSRLIGVFGHAYLATRNARVIPIRSGEVEGNVSLGETSMIDDGNARPNPRPEYRKYRSRALAAPRHVVQSSMPVQNAGLPPRAPRLNSPFSPLGVAGRRLPRCIGCASCDCGLCLSRGLRSSDRPPLLHAVRQFVERPALSDANT